MTILNDKNYAHCKEKSNACSENERRFEITGSQSGRQNLFRIKVDKCIYNDSDVLKRCDYIFELKDSFSCFVELKGKHIKDAVLQLNSSLQEFSAEVSGKKYAFIVASKNELPNAKTERQKWERMFKTKYDAKFDMKNAKMSKHIDELK